MKNIIFIILFFLSDVLVGQNWHKIYQYNVSEPLFEKHLDNIQFISPDVGYFSTYEKTYGSSPGYADLYMTKNSGKDWTKIYTLSGEIGTSAVINFDYLDEEDFFIYDFSDGSLGFGRAYRDSVVVGTASTPYPPPYIKNINKDTIIVSSLSEENYLFIMIPDQENLRKIQITDNYVYRYPTWYEGYDLISSVCFISGFGAAIGVLDGIKYFYSSGNNFENWTKDTLNIPESIKKVYFANRDAGFLICTDSVLYRTDNSGSDWEISSLPQGFYINDIQFGKTKGYIIGNEGKLASTEDFGITWHLETINTSNTIRRISVINDIAYVVDSEGQIFTNIPIDTINAEYNVNIYPNPFRNEIEIVSDKVIYSCNIYNVDGLIIKTVPDINKSSVGIDLTNLATGIYFVETVFEKGVSINKVVKD